MYFSGDILTEDLDPDDLHSFAVAVFSYQLVVALILPDGVWVGDLRLQSCPVHLNTRRKMYLFIQLVSL